MVEKLEILRKFLYSEFKKYGKYSQSRQLRGSGIMRTNIQVEFNLWNFCWPSPDIHTKVRVTLRKAGSILNWEERLIASTMWFTHYCCCSVTQLCPTLCDPMDCSTPGFPLLHYLLEFAQTRIHPAISSSAIPFSSCLQSFPVSRSFPMSQLFTSGGQSIGASASASVLPMTIQDWFSLGLTGLITLLSKGLSKVFPNTTVWKHKFFSAQPSLWSNSHIHTWLLEKP